MSEFKVFVGNVPYSMDQNDFVKLFEKRKDYVSADLLKFSNSDKTRGCGFASFSTEEGRDALLSEIMKVGEENRELRFSVYVDKSNEDRSYKLFLRDVVDENVNLDSLKAVGVKSLIKFEKMLDRKTNEFTGNAILHLSNYDEMVELLKGKEMNVGGNKMRIYPFRNKRSLVQKDWRFSKGFQAGFQAATKKN